MILYSHSAGLHLVLGPFSAFFSDTPSLQPPLWIEHRTAGMPALPQIHIMTAYQADSMQSHIVLNIVLLNYNL